LNLDGNLRGISMMYLADNINIRLNIYTKNGKKGFMT